MRQTTKRIIALGAGVIIAASGALAATAAVQGTTGNRGSHSQAGMKRVFVCFNDRDSSKNYIEFRHAPNGCQGNNGYSQWILEGDQAGVDDVSQTKDGKGFTVTYLDGRKQTVNFPEGSGGENGKDGKDGVAGYEVIGRGTDAKSVDSGATETITTLCSSHDEKAISGGIKNVNPKIVMNGSQPAEVKQDPNYPNGTGGDEAGRWVAGGWSVTVTNNSDKAVTLQPQLVCANISTTPADAPTG